ncbi:MAG: sensor histidine kinase [Candidatus Saccharimonadales bacterium]
MQIINTIIINFYNRFVKPLSVDEDIKRREFIFNMLLLSVITLVSVGLLIAAINRIIQAEEYRGLSPWVTLIALLVLLGLYTSNRYKFRNINTHIFLQIFLVLATVGLYKYGYVLASAILIYMLVIVMASILISVRASFTMAALVIIALASIAYLQLSGTTQPYLGEHHDPLSVINLIIFVLLFCIVLLVSSLSNIEIERSLKRARQSEKELLKERKLLEIKVAKRTRELERAQVEKTMEMYRFAEFGRLSSTMLHDITNPLTAVSLNLEQLGGRKKSKIHEQICEGVSHMEQYVHSARRQLRHESEEKVFDSRLEIERVHGLLLAKARNERVALHIQLDKNAYLYGDSIKFNQIISNLLANSIDSFNGDTKKRLKTIKIHSKQVGKRLSIIVSDNGIGIPEHEIKHIFKPFFTTKASDRGAGIGLTIIRQIIEEDFNGTIKVKSSKRGTSFTVTIQLYQP